MGLQNDGLVLGEVPFGGSRIMKVLLLSTTEVLVASMLGSSGTSYLKSYGVAQKIKCRDALRP